MAINDQPVVVDFTVGKDAMVWPMVAAGTSNDEIHGRPRHPSGLRQRGDNAMTRHTLSVLVENKPGVLARVAGLFSRRGFNIESLAVGPTEHPEISRITIVVSVEGAALEQVTKQLNKLVNVLKIVELEEKQAVQRETAAGQGARRRHHPARRCCEIVELFQAKVVDVGPEALTIEVTGRPDKLDAMLKMLEPYGIREMVQSGMVALGRGPRSMTQAGTAARSSAAPSRSYRPSQERE